MNLNKPRGNLLSYAIFFGLSWYCVLCTLHLFNPRPLWNDEACVFESIKEFDTHLMFHHPLKAVQVFPRVYLFLIQQFSSLFDFALLSLRLPSFICMLFAFFVWQKIVRKELEAQLDRLLFILCWLASAVLIYYSAELKQYSMDVLTASLLFLFLKEQTSLQTNLVLFRVCLLLLPGLLLFSYPVATFLPLILFNLLKDCRRNKNNFLSLMIYVFSLIFFTLIAFNFDMRLRPIAAVTSGYGDYFISLTSIGDFFKTLTEGVGNLFFRWFVERPRIYKRIGTFFLAFGLIYLFYGFIKKLRKENFRFDSGVTIAGGVFLGLFLLGLFKKYPFSVPRTSLFFCPMVFMLTIQAMRGVQRLNKLAYKMVIGLFIVYLLMMNVGLSTFVLQRKLNPAPEILKEILPPSLRK